MSEIKNVVFDVGKVLIYWDPRTSMIRANERYGDSLPFGKFTETDMDQVIYSVFVDPEVWKNEDISLMSHEEMKEFLKKRADGDKHLEDMIGQYYDHSVDSVYDYDYVEKWIADLKARGLKVYYLSNFGEGAQKEAVRLGAFKFLKDMDGGLFSYEIHKVKPDREIYDAFLERYGLKAGECIFVDDNPANVLAAGNYGWNGIHFAGYEDARRRIAALTEG